MLQIITTWWNVRQLMLLIFVTSMASCSFSASGGTDISPNLDAVGRDSRATDAGRVDAARGDAMSPPGPFDVTLCPADYKTIGAVTTSRYRAGAQAIAISWGAAAQACEADSPARTHLVVFESLAEYNAVVPTLQAEHAFNYSWTGTFRYVENLVPRIGTVTGQTAGILDLLKYDTGVMQNLTQTTRATFVLGTDFRYSNNPLDYNYNFICECDGRAGGQRPL